MNDYVTYLRSLIDAELVTVEGMKAENIIRQQRGKALAFSEEQFSVVSGEIRRLADMINQAR